MNSTTAPLWCKVPKFEISKDAKIDIPAYGGRMDVRWDPGTKVTASGGLAYFALFLKTTGLFESLCSDFPVDYRSNNSCSKRDIVGTMVLAILFGKDRYVQINALRNDTAAMELLGLGRIVSEDTVRRSLRKADGKALDDWLSRHEHEAVDATALSQLYRDRGDCESNFTDSWGDSPETSVGDGIEPLCYTIRRETRRNCGYDLRYGVGGDWPHAFDSAPSDGRTGQCRGLG